LETIGIKSGKNIIRLFLENPASRRLKMQKSKGFTLIELLVVIAIIALLLSIVMPALRRAKDLAKKIDCSANLHSLALAAILYADEHDALTPSSTNTWNDNGIERAGWCGVTSMISTGEPLPVQEQIYGNDSDQFTGLHKSQLWDYIETPDAWRCPADPDKKQLRSYSMAAQWWGTHTQDDDSVWYDDRTTGMVYRKVSRVKGSGQRLMFIDQLGRNWDAYFAIWYSQPMWWNTPSFMHSGGSVNGFADGHVEAYKMDAETVKVAEQSYEEGGIGMPQVEVPDSEDLKYYQRATWGKLGW
jgi:prepilin-type N-terminal cleavage/methylation domain-containing protein/prepilin-type processing-associated H-X9-DG protein